LINQNKYEFSFAKKSTIKMLLIYEMPKEVRKDVIILYIIISIMYL
jgi:hypothetical protein